MLKSKSTALIAVSKPKTFKQIINEINDVQGFKDLKDLKIKIEESDYKDWIGVNDIDEQIDTDSIGVTFTYKDSKVNFCIQEQPDCCGVFFAHGIQFLGYTITDDFVLLWVRFITLFAAFRGYSIVRFTHVNNNQAVVLVKTLKDWNTKEWTNNRTGNIVVDCEIFI